MPLDSKPSDIYQANLFSSVAGFNQWLQGTLTRFVENAKKSWTIPFSLLVSAPDLNR